MQPLTTPEDLLANHREVTLLDVRWQLGREDGHEQYLAGHIPGAAYVDLETDLADRPGAGGRHPLPDPARFVAAMQRCGVTSSRPVVVYDDAAGRSAARAWWLLRHYGHPSVSVLDGGWSWWRRVGGPAESGEPSRAPGDFGGAPGALPVVDADGALDLAGRGVLVDARAPERFRGEVEPVDPVAGHIPGAVNVPTDANLERQGPRAGRFRSAEDLRAVWEPVVGQSDEVGVYCGSGVTAAHDLLALAVLGRSASLYPGSWSHWVTDPSRPVA